MWKNHFLIPIGLVVAMGIAVLGYFWKASLTDPPPKRYDIAAGEATFEVPEFSVSEYFELPVPSPVDRVLFSGPIRGYPGGEDVVAQVNCKYAFTDRNELDAGQRPGEISIEKVIVNELEITKLVTTMMVSEFPIRRDDAGFYYGFEPIDGRSSVTHRFESQNMDQLALESISYFLSILPLDAHDRRRTLLKNDMIQMPSPSK